MIDNNPNSKSKKKNRIEYLEELSKDKNYLEYRQREIKKQLELGIRRYVYCSGMMIFPTYEEKLIFLKSGAGFFGVTLYKNKCVKFFDADFVNNLMITQFIEEDLPAKTFVSELNKHLLARGFTSEIEIPDYQNKAIQKEILESGAKSFVRFNSFLETYNAYNILKSSPSVKVRINKLIVDV